MAIQSSEASYDQLKHLEKIKSDMLVYLNEKLTEWTDATFSCEFKHSKYQELMVVAKQSLEMLKNDIDLTKKRIVNSRKVLLEYERQLNELEAKKEDESTSKLTINEKTKEEFTDFKKSSSSNQPSVTPNSYVGLQHTKENGNKAIEKSSMDTNIESLDQKTLDTDIIVAENGKRSLKSPITKPSKVLSKSKKERLQELTEQSERTLKKQKVAAQSIAKVLQESNSTSKFPLSTSSAIVSTSKSTLNSHLLSQSKLIESKMDLISILYRLIIRVAVDRNQFISTTSLEEQFKTYCSQSFSSACQQLQLNYKTIDEFAASIPEWFLCCYHASGCCFLKIVSKADNNIKRLIPKYVSLTKEELMTVLSVQQKLMRDLMLYIRLLGDDGNRLLLRTNSLLRSLDLSSKKLISFSLFHESSRQIKKNYWFRDMGHIINIEDYKQKMETKRKSNKGSNVIFHPYNVKESFLLCIRAYRLHPNFEKTQLPVLSRTFAHHIKPLKTVCRHDLFGECNDDECIFQHERDYLPPLKTAYEDLLLYTESYVEAFDLSIHSYEALAKRLIRMSIQANTNSDNLLILKHPNAHNIIVEKPKSSLIRYFSTEEAKVFDDFVSRLRQLTRSKINKENCKDLMIAKTISKNNVQSLLVDDDSMLVVEKGDNDVSNIDCRYYEDSSIEQTSQSLKERIDNDPTDVDAWLYTAFDMLQHMKRSEIGFRDTTKKQKIQLLNKVYREGSLNNSQSDELLHLLSRALEVEGNTEDEALWLFYLGIFLSRPNEGLTDKLEMFGEALDRIPNSHSIWSLFLSFKMPIRSINDGIQLYLQSIRFFSDIQEQQERIGNSNLFLSIILSLFQLLEEGGYHTFLHYLINAICSNQVNDLSKIDSDAYLHDNLKALVKELPSVIKKCLEQEDIEVVWLQLIHFSMFDRLVEYRELVNPFIEQRDLDIFCWTSDEVEDAIKHHSHLQNWHQNIRHLLKEALSKGSSYSQPILLNNEVMICYTQRDENLSELLDVLEKNGNHLIYFPDLLLNLCTIYCAINNIDLADALMLKCIKETHSKSEAIYFAASHFLGFTGHNSIDIKKAFELFIQDLSSSFPYSWKTSSFDIDLEEIKIASENWFNNLKDKNTKIDIFNLLILIRFSELKFGQKSAIECLEEILKNKRILQLERRSRIRLVLEYLRLIESNISLKERIEAIDLIFKITSSHIERLKWEKQKIEVNEDLSNALVLLFPQEPFFSERFELNVWKYFVLELPFIDHEKIYNKLYHLHLRHSALYAMDFTKIALQENEFLKAHREIQKAMDNHSENVNLCIYSIQLEIYFNNIDKAYHIAKESLRHSPLHTGLISKIVECSKYHQDFNSLLNDYKEYNIISSSLFSDFSYEDETRSLINRLKLLKVPKLQLSHQSLSEVPPITFLYSSLIELDISHNCLVYLPSAFENLQNLINLNVSYNCLVDLSSSLSKLAKLKHLNLSFNYLVQLPDEFDQLVQLESLNLHSNLLENIPFTLGNLNLLELRLSSNLLKSLPSSLRSSKHKKCKMVLDGNPMISVLNLGKISLYDSLPACMQCGKEAGNTQKFNDRTLCPKCIIAVLTSQIG